MHAQIGVGILNRLENESSLVAVRCAREDREKAETVSTEIEASVEAGLLSNNLIFTFRG